MALWYRAFLARNRTTATVSRHLHFPLLPLLSPRHSLYSPYLPYTKYSSDLQLWSANARASIPAFYLHSVLLYELPKPTARHIILSPAFFWVKAEKKYHSPTQQQPTTRTNQNPTQTEKHLQKDRPAREIQTTEACIRDFLLQPLPFEKEKKKKGIIKKSDSDFSIAFLGPVSHPSFFIHPLQPVQSLVSTYLKPLSFGLFSVPQISKPGSGTTRLPSTNQTPQSSSSLPQWKTSKRFSRIILLRTAAFRHQVPLPRPLTCRWSILKYPRWLDHLRQLGCRS